MNTRLTIIPTKNPPRYRAVIGSSAARVHIWDVESRERLSLCENIAVVAPLSGRIEADKFCQKCMKKLQARLSNCTAITAETIGCREIV